MIQKSLFVALLVLVLAACSDRPAASPEAAFVASKQTPALTVETFQGGKFDLAEHRGKWVVVNFWATWCAPCLKEIPDFNAFAKSRKDVQFIGLAYEEIEAADMSAFLKEHPIDYPFAIIDVYNPPEHFETPRGLPMTVLIAPGGKVVKTFLGPVTSADLAEIIGPPAI
ncbi:MAG: hypothetical protein RLZZ537_546 [Pseudomonadota bacterium]